MAYQITNTNGTTITVADNAVDSTYSVQLVGKNRTNYGATINQNFFRLMENFSSGSAPTSPQLGQAWFDSTHSTLKVYGGVVIGWKPLSGIATSEPSGPVAGDMWFDTVNQQLKVYAGSAWVAINSGVVSGGLNGAITETVNAGNVSYYVSSLYASGVRVAVLSKDPVTGTGVTGFGNLVAGINYNTSISTSTVNGNVVGATAVFTSNANVGGNLNLTGEARITGNANVVGNISANIGVFTGAVSITGNANVGNIGAVAGVFTGSLALKAPVTVTASTYTMLATDSSLIINGVATCTVTLLDAATYPGRILNIKTTAAYTVVSAGSNVVPVAGGAAGTAILAATAGKWAMLQSNGTNWVTMMAG